MERNVKAGTARISVPTPIDTPYIMQKMSKGSVVPSAHGHKIKVKEEKAKGTPQPSGVKREVRTKPTAEPEPAKPKPAKKTPSDEELLAALVKAYKDKPLSSREISDAAGISDPEIGRQAVRSAMKRLVDAGKVETVKADKGRAALLYKPKA